MLDGIDIKVLQALEFNSRQSISNIARACDVSRDVVEYRMAKLVESGVIRNFLTGVDQTAFCSGVGTLLCKLKRSDDALFLQVLEKLKFIDNINWVAEICGSYDLVIVILYKDISEFDKISSLALNLLSPILISHDTSFYLEEVKHFAGGLFSNGASPKNKIVPYPFQKPNNHFAKLDSVDKSIICELGENSRISNSEVARVVGVSEDVVRLRIKKLEKYRIISGYTITIDPEKLGFEYYYVGLRFNILDSLIKSRFYDFVNNCPFISYCVNTTGKYNFILDLHAKNRNHFTNVLVSLRREFADSLLDYEFQLIIDLHKEVFVPKGLISKA